MRRSPGQVFVLARYKVVDSHTRGEANGGKNARNAINVRVASRHVTGRSNGISAGKFQADRASSLSAFWLLVVFSFFKRTRR